MNEQEKNKTLAEFAGLRVEYLWASEDYDSGGYFIDPPGRKSEYKDLQVWAFEHPQEKGHWFEIPEFTESPDDCFAWLTPKLDRITLEWDSYAKDMWWVRVNGEYDATDKKLAIALCNAIIELLDEK